MKTKRTKLERELDKRYDETFRTRAKNVQFNIMDLSKLQKETIEGYLAGKQFEEAFDAAVVKYRQN